MRKCCRLTLILIFLLVIPLTGSDEEKTQPGLPIVCVMLEPDENIDILTENPVYVKSGEDVRFDIRIDDGYAVTGISGGEYSDGVITVKPARYPTTVKLDITPKKKLAVTLYKGEGAQVLYNFSDGKVYTGDKINIKVDVSDGFIYGGLSTGNYLDSGGVLLSLSDKYSFTAIDDIDIYVNTLGESKVLMPREGYRKLIYYVNGGKITGTDKDYVADEILKDYYLCPNTRPDMGYFTREGYVLLGYNTMPDGSGKFYGCEWNVPTGDNDYEILYAQWAKTSAISDFKYHEDGDGGIVITEYIGSDGFVVIPEEINGVPVTTVAAGCFDGEKFTGLMITKNIRTVEDKAICDCEYFTELYFTDGVLAITDNFITGCDNLKTLYMISTMNPRYGDDRDGTYAIKATPHRKVLRGRSQSSIIIKA